MEMEMEVGRPKAVNLCQLDDGRLMVVGHRGFGMNVVDYSPDSRSSKTFRENTVASFKAAAATAHLHFLEFDVQVRSLFNMYTCMHLSYLNSRSPNSFF
ncbi:hypothetical protein V2J09_013263 [Rumex salicifolius]